MTNGGLQRRKTLRSCRREGSATFGEGISGVVPGQVGVPGDPLEGNNNWREDRTEWREAGTRAGGAEDRADKAERESDRRRREEKEQEEW